MFEEIEIFNKKVNIRNYFCSSEPKKFEKGNLKLNLYIKITDACNAKCEFCSNKETKDNGIIDLNKLKEVLIELKNKDLINRIGITGGEPFLKFELLNNILNLIYEVNPRAMVTINTNGYNLRNILKLDNIDKLEGVHISRHHYDDLINQKIFDLQVATNKDIEYVINNVKNKKLIRLNCLLMKSNINSNNEIQQYLEEASKLNIFRVGFVALMPINEYSNKEYININDVLNTGDKFLDSGHYYDYDICECRNGVYIASNGNLVEYYLRMTKNLSCEYSRQLVYTSDNKLKVGFGNDSLI